jgi:hypothetical protein
MNDFMATQVEVPYRSPLLVSRCAILFTAFCQCSPCCPNESIIWGWHFCVSLGEISTYSVKEAQYMTFASTRTRQTFPSTILCCTPNARFRYPASNIHQPHLPKQTNFLSITNHCFLTLFVRREINRVRFGAHDIGTRKLVRTNNGILLVGLSSGLSLVEISSSCSFSEIRMSDWDTDRVL